MTNKKMIISACSIALSGVILLNAQTAHASDTNVTSESIQTTNSLSNSSTGTSSDAQSTTASNDNTTETASQNTQTSNETNTAGKTLEDTLKRSFDYKNAFIDYNNIKEINQTINYKDRTTGEEIAPSNNQTQSLVPWYDTKKVTLKYIVDNSSNNKNNPNAGQVIQTYDVYQGAGSTLQFDFAAVAKSFQDAVSTTPGIEGTNHWHVQDTSHLATYKIDGNYYGDTSITIKVTPDTYDDGNSITYANLPTSMYKTEKIVNLDGAKKYYAQVDGNNIIRAPKLSGNDINFYFNEVKSPYIKNYKLEDPNQLIIPANSQPLADGQSQIIDVYYQPVSTSSIVEEALPDTMVDFNSIKEVTQTINYKDKTTGKELASANIQTQSLVPYYQTSTVTIEVRSVDFAKLPITSNINNFYEYAENYPLKDKVIQTYHITQPVGSTLQFDTTALDQELSSTTIRWNAPGIGAGGYRWYLDSSSYSIGNVKFTESNQTVRLYIKPDTYFVVAPDPELSDDPELGKYADGFVYYPEVPNSFYKTENITNHVFAGGTPSYAIVKDNQIIKSGITNPADTNFEFEAVASPNIKNYQLVDTNQHTIPETSENAANAASRTIDVLYTQSGQSDTGTPLTDEVKPVANIINFVDPDGNPVKDPDGNPVTKKVSGNPGDPITLDLPKGFHFPNGKTPDITIDPDKPVVNIPVIKDLTDTGDPLTEQTKPVANVINYVDPDGNPVKDPDGNPVIKRVSGNPGDPISLDLPKGFHFPDGKTPDISIDPDKPVVNIPVIKDLTDTGDPLSEQVKPVANIINFVDPDGNPIKDPDGNPVTKKVSGNPGDPITLDLPKGFHFPNGKTPDIAIDPDKPVVNIPVIKDLTDTGDPLSEQVKPVANIINFVDPDGNPIKDPDGNPVTKKVSGNPGDPITLDLPKGFHFPNGKTPDIAIDPDKPVVNIPVIKDLTDTGDPLTEQTKPVANVINYVDPDGNPVKDPDGNPVTKKVSGNPGDPITLDLPKGFHFPNGKTPDITIDPDKPVINIPVIKDGLIINTGDPLVDETKPVANIINYVDPDGNPVKDPDGNPVTKRVSGNPGDPISLDLPKGFHFPNGKTPDITIDPDKPVVNIPVIKDLTDTGDPLTEQVKPVANIINFVDPDGNPVKDPDGNPVTKKVSGNPGDPISLDLPKGFHFPNGKTPDITIDPDKPVVNVPVIKDLTDTGDPLVNETKPVANIINYVDPDGNPVKDPDGNPVTKKVSGNPGDPISLDLPKGFHFPNGKTPDITIDPDKPVVNVPVIKDLTDTGDPLVNETKPVANIINYVDPDGNPVKDPDGNPVTKKVSGNPGDPISLDLPKGFHFPDSKTPDIAIDPAKPVVNIPIIKDLTDTGDPLVNEAKPVANIINYVDPDGNPVKDPDGNPVIKRVSGNPGDPITLDLPKGFHFPNGKTPDIAIDPAKPVVNVPVIKDLTDTGDPLVNEAKPNLNIPIKDTNNSGNQKEDNDQRTNDNDKVQEPVDQININTPSIDLIQPTGKVTDNQSKAKINTSNQKQQEKLPQTGSDSILSTISLGFVSLLSALGLSVSKKRKN